MELTSMSSRGQVVIPQEVRTQLNLHEGEKFMVHAQEDTILLKKIEEPSWDDLLKGIRKEVQHKGITPKDVQKAIKRVRAKNSSRY